MTQPLPDVPQERSQGAAAPRQFSSRLAHLIANLSAYREQLRMNQAEFWERYGATQSTGCRYEQGRMIPKPMQLLLALEEMGAIDEEVLERAHARLARARRQLGWSRR